MDRLTGGGREERRQGYRTPADMTGDQAIRGVIRWGERELEHGRKVLVLDMSDTTDVNSSLVAAIVLLSRRAKPLRATLKIIGYSEQLESLMRIYKLWTPLAQSGVILEPKEHAVRSALRTDTPAPVSQDSHSAAHAPSHLPSASESRTVMSDKVVSSATLI